MTNCVKTSLSSVLVAGALLLGTPVQAEETHAVSHSGGKAEVGKKGSASVTIQGKNGWHVNEQAPISLKLNPSSGISVDKAKLGRKDLAESTQDRARFDVSFTGAAAGAGEIACEASFVMCQESACKPVKEKLVVALEIGAAGGDGAPAKGDDPQGSRQTRKKKGKKKGKK